MGEVNRTNGNARIEPVSVCIPAHNEAGTIVNTIESVLRQTGVHVAEILVGANACTDDTVGEVRRMEKQHPGIVRLLEIEEKGKPHTWNVLREEAAHDYLIFMDGDVEVDPPAFSRLHEMLRARDDLIIAQSTNAAVLRDCNWLTRLSRPRPNAEGGIYIKERQDHTCGRLYAIRRSGIESVMDELGFDKMPVDLIHEDGWLRRLLDIAASRRRDVPLEEVIPGNGRYWEVCRDAYVYFVPQDWTEDPKVIARTLHAREQLDAMFPEYVVAVKGIRTARAADRRLMDRIRARVRTGLRDGTKQAVVQVMRRIATRKARRLFAADKAAGRSMSARTFARSTSSKRAANSVGIESSHARNELPT